MGLLGLFPSFTLGLFEARLGLVRVEAPFRLREEVLGSAGVIIAHNLCLGGLALRLAACQGWEQ